MAEYNALKAADDAAKAAAKAFDDAVDAIVVDLNAGKAIADAEAAYAALAVPGYATKKALLDEKKAAYEKLVADNAAADAVDALIDAIGEVTLDSGDAIVAAENAYAALTDDQKAFVDDYAVLTAARETYDALVAYKEAQDAASAVNKVGATSLVISDSLAINYKIKVDADYTIVRMEFTLADVTTVVTDYTIDSTGKYVFRYDNIAPNLMGETIYSVIVVKDENGNEIKCYAQEYSVATYANRKIATSAYTELLASMINYGDAAVAYTDNVYAAPSAQITDWATYSASIAPVREYTSIYAISSDITAPAVTWGSANLILNDSVNIRIKLTGEISDGYKVIAVYNDTEYQFNIESDEDANFFVWDLFNMAQMSNACVINFTVCDADGNAVSNTLTYSVESYVADMLQRDAKLDALLTSLMQYGDAALAFKHVNG